MIKTDAPDTTTETLSLANISKSYSGVAALTDVSVHIRPGEVHAILGENGAGKSTLMNVATGTTQPDSGIHRLRGTGRPRAGPQDGHLARDRDRPPAPCGAARHDRAREPAGRAARLGVRRRRRPRGGAAADRRGRAAGPPARPRRDADARGEAPARDRQGVRRASQAARARRADRAARCRRRRRALRTGPGRRGRRHRRHLHHAPHGRGPGARRPGHRAARRSSARHLGRRRHQRRRAAGPHHRAQARLHLPAEARRGRGRAAELRARGPDRAGVRRRSAPPPGAGTSSGSPGSSATVRASCCVPWPAWSRSPGRWPSRVPRSPPAGSCTGRRTCRPTGTPRDS